MLKLEGVGKTYRIGAFGGKELRAVHDVSFEVRPGEVVSLIGESGSGKSTIGKMVLKLLPPTTGKITLDADGDYYRHVQGVFQDPFSSYNPIFKADRVFEMVRQGFGLPSQGWREKVESALLSVRLDPGAVLGKYPHQLSGGQLQRMLIARALLLDLKILVADEIISMLDASTRIDVLNLLGELRERGLGILFITHDLSLGNYVSDRTLVLYKGQVVETGRTDLVFGNPLHPYTRRLLASLPQLHRKWEPLEDEGPIDVRGTGLAEAEPGHFVYS